MRELARRAGVNVAMAYHLFGSKHELYLAVFRELGYLDAIRKGPELSVALLKGAKPRRVVEEILAGTWILMGSPATRLLLIEALKGDKDARAIVTEFRQEGLPRLEWLLVETDVVSKRRAPSLARAIHDVIWGVLTDAIMNDVLEADHLRGRAKELAAVLITRS